MSDITQNFEITSIDLGVTVNTNQLTFTPDGISLNIYAGGVGTSNSLNADIANVHIYGGTNGYVLQTDGTGNLDWTAMTGGGGGNGTPGGANTQVQYNDSGSFGGSAGFTFNEVTGNLNVPSNVIAPNFIGNVSVANTALNVAGANVSGQVANSLIAGTVYTNAQPNITSVGTLTGLTVTANITGNISGSAGTAGTAVTAGTVTTAAQPNITSVGNLSNLTVTGNIISGNANLGNAARANFFIGSGNNLSNIQAANISGVVPNANYASYAGNVVNSAQPNITSVGTLTSLSISGMTKIAPAQEKVFISTTNTFDVNNQGVIYNTTPATGNIDLNFSNVNAYISNSNSFVGTYILTNGSTPYSILTVSIDNIESVIIWFNGSPPITYANSLMAYTFTIIKTTTTPTFTVLGSGTVYL